MLPVACACGKNFEVSPSLAGKRVTCPDCGEVILVKARSSSAVSTRAMKPVPAPAASSASSSAEKPASSSTRLVLILGALAFGLFVVFVGLLLLGVLAWFLLHGDSTPPPPTETEAGPTYAVKLFAPRKTGDLRQVVLNAEEQRSIGGGVKGETLTWTPQKLKVRLQCKIRTLETDVSGWETRVEVSEIQSVFSYANEEKLFPEKKDPPQVYIGTIDKTAAGRTMRFREKQAKADLGGDFARFLSWACVRDVTGVSISDDDLIFGTPQPQPLGSDWEINKTAAAELFPGGLVARPTINEGTAKITQILKDNFNELAVVEARFSGEAALARDPKDNGMIESATGFVDMSLTYRVPLMSFQGPVQWSAKLETKKVGKLSAKLDQLVPKLGDMGIKGDNVSPTGDAPINATSEEKVVIECKLDCTYLPRESPPVEAPAPKIETKTPDKLSLRLLNPAKVEWIAGQPAIRTEVGYRIYAGKPSLDAKYVLYVAFASAGPQKIPFTVQEIGGSGVFSEGKFLSPTTQVAYPPPNSGNLCDLILMEETLANPKGVLLDKLEKVPVLGAPPVPPEPTGRPPILLSNAKVERMPNKTMRFTVDYEFTAAPDGDTNYQLLARLTGTKVNIPLPVVKQGKGYVEFFKQGTIAKEMSIDSSADTRFELWINRITPSNQAGEIASNILKGPATGTAPDNLPLPPTPPHFLITNSAVKKQPPGALAGLQWNLQKGQINPQAVYSAVIELKGVAKKGVGPQQIFTTPGGQLQSMGATTGKVIFLGETTYEMYIVEQVPGQQLRIVSEKTKGKVQN